MRLLRQLKAYGIFALLLAVLAILSFGCAAEKIGAVISGNKKVHINMVSRAIIKDIPKDAKVLDLWMPYPEDQPNQIITDIKVKSPYPTRITYEKEYGRPILYSRVKSPKKDFEVSIDYSVIRTEKLAGNLTNEKGYSLRGADEFKRWMRYDKVGNLTPLLKGLSNRLTRNKKNNVDKAKAIYDYIIEKYIYDFEKRNLPKIRGDLHVVCSTKKGRCTELSTLFATLARASGIPVRYISGYTFRNIDEGDIAGYCCWVEFYSPGNGWIPVDLADAKKFPESAEYYFGNTDEWRISLGFGRDFLLEPPQKGPRLNVWIDPYVEIDGKPFEAQKRLTWRKK